MAIGTTGTPSWIATMAAPGFASPGSPECCRVPSTKSPSTPPSRTVSRMRRSASRSDSPRRTAMVPCARISCEKPGWSKSSVLATNAIRRGQTVPSTGMSMKAAWLTARTHPPSRGRRSVPYERMRTSTRVAVARMPLPTVQ